MRHIQSHTFNFKNPLFIRFVPLGISFADSHIPHGEIGNLYDFLYQLKHLKVMNYLGAV